MEIIEFSSFGTPKMRNIVMSYLATILGESQFNDVFKFFKQIDVNKNGTI